VQITLAISLTRTAGITNYSQDKARFYIDVPDRNQH
jgi:hypothetical protein